MTKYLIGYLVDYMKGQNQYDIKNICLAAFASYYFKLAKVENYYQPDCLTDDATMVDSFGLNLPKKLKLSSTLAIQGRNNQAVLQYYKLNQNLFPEDYAHQLLMLYYAFLTKVISI